MSWPAIVMYLVIAFVGLPAAFRNPTAFALVVAWLVPEILYHFTQNNLPLKIYFMADIVVIAVIFGKATVREGCRTYPTLREQLHCAFTAITAYDRWVITGFVFAAWPLYVVEIDPRSKWFALFSIVILQFLLAAGEAIMLGDREGRRRMSEPPAGHDGLAFAGHRKYG